MDNQIKLSLLCVIAYLITGKCDNCQRIISDYTYKIRIGTAKNVCGKLQNNVTFHSKQSNDMDYIVDVQQTHNNHGFEVVMSITDKNYYKSEFRGDYTLYPGFGFYKFHQPLDWHTARVICESEDAHLSVANSQEEANLFVKILQENTKSVNPKPTYILSGFHDIVEEGKYMSILGGSLNNTGYTKWRPGQPDNFNNEDCGSMANTGLLNDCLCTVTVYFICEKELY